MAIVIKQEPEDWTPAYNQMWYVVESTNAGQTNFRYIADVYVSGDSGRQARLICNPDSNWNEGVFDIHRIVESYLGGLDDSIDPFDISRSVNGFGLAASSMVAYEVKFGEQYGVTSAIINYTDLTVTGTKYAFNGAYDTHDFVSYTGQVTLEQTQSFLNEMTSPQQYDFSGNPDRFLHYITTASGTAYFAEIKTYDLSGNLVQTAKIQNPYQNATIFEAYKRQYFSAGMRSLNNASLYSGVQPLIDDSIGYYTVQLTNFAGAATSSLFQFNNDQTCYAGRSPINLHFLTRYGAFDSYEFTMVNRYKTTKTTDTYRRMLGTHANNSISYTESDAGEVVHDTRVQARYELQSDWISLDNSGLIQQLIESPVVFMEHGSGLVRGRIVSPTEAELKAEIFGDIELHNVKIVFQLSQEYNRQRG